MSEWVLHIDISSIECEKLHFAVNLTLISFTADAYERRDFTFSEVLVISTLIKNQYRKQLRVPFIQINNHNEDRIDLEYTEIIKFGL